MSVPWRVGLLGAGMMAQGFDRPGAARVLSMAHAFSRSERFAVGGFFDAQDDRAAHAERTWRVPPSPRDRSRWFGVGWDVIYIATPDAQHGADLRDALARGPRAVLVEKPLSADHREGRALLEEAERRGVVVMVNYPRRWHSATLGMHAMAQSGGLPPPDAASVAVSGGGAHNLSHVIDFIHAVWGAGWTLERICDAAPPLRSVLWRRGSHAFPMTIVECASHYVWEVHLFTATGKLELSRSPEVLEWWTPAPHPDYPSYQVLTPTLRADMEAEPLLCRTVAALAAAIDDPAVASGASRRELESQQLVTAVLQCFASTD